MSPLPIFFPQLYVPSMMGYPCDQLGSTVQTLPPPSSSACHWNKGNLSPAAALSRGLCGQSELVAEAEHSGRPSCPQTQSQVPTLKDKVSWENRKKTSVKHLDNTT